MKFRNLSQLADHALLCEFAAALANVHTAIAVLLAYLAELDERKLYLPAGYASAHDLLAAATHKTNAEIELLLAERFPKPEVPTLVHALAPAAATDPLAVRPVAALASQLAPGPVAELATPTAHVSLPSATPAAPPEPRPRVAPLAPERFALHGTMGQSMHDKLRYAQALLSRSVPGGDVMQVLEQGLDALIEQLEQRRFAATVRTRPRKSKANGRYVPAEIRRTVCQRDGGRCTFVGNNGHRCESRERLEFDHVIPVARGGRTTAENLRQRCRAHNQFEAERVFGAGFMHEKRQAAPGGKAAAPAPRGLISPTSCTSPACSLGSPRSRDEPKIRT
jgi:5-methylcytosine-specific restriction endonuclease McrA